MIYRQFAPDPRLAGHIKCLWYLQRGPSADAAPDRILPDGCMELIFTTGTPFHQVDERGALHRQPQAFLVGQISRHVLLQLVGALEVVAVRFHPGGARAFFPVDLDEVTDRDIALEHFGRAWRELAQRLGETASVAARFRILEAGLLQLLARSAPADPRVHGALQLLDRTHGGARIAAVAESLRFSERHLERTFRRQVGLSPKQYARIVRFRRVLGSLERADPRWADLAAEAGYADQAHFSREFRALSGLSPRAYLATQTPFAAALLG